ncbi:MAG: AmmeMemoRadiSam system radical SAM enzyme [Candidatus Omnitrophota bacterium]|nr:AmmeMemoRadiSam system radical SAM enzyme [Candidatus Omnitrophota bacterium]
MSKEALLYEKREDKSVRCGLCAHRCAIANNKFGFCGVRQNINGVLYTYAYARAIAAQIDPVEKKPLYHFIPGHLSFSLAAAGCNFRCGFCQNWEISQVSLAKEGLSPRGTAPLLPGEDLLPQQIVSLAIENKCKSISYTYTEPTIFFEYALETAKLAKEKGLYNIFVTNGYMTKEALLLIRPYLDAANIDLKFFKDSSYRKVCAASLAPVLDSIRLMHKLGVWVEVTTLLVPGENDSEAELRDIAQFISGVDRGIPWHISRFHPMYKFRDKSPTPEAALKKAQGLGSEAGLEYIYIGNVSLLGSDTQCHNCKKLLIKREGFSVLEHNIKTGRCAFCATAIPGIFE